LDTSKNDDPFNTGIASERYLQIKIPASVTAGLSGKPLTAQRRGGMYHEVNMEILNSEQQSALSNPKVITTEVNDATTTLLCIGCKAPFVFSTRDSFGVIEWHKRNHQCQPTAFVKE
jgi:hypothetical protein